MPSNTNLVKIVIYFLTLSFFISCSEYNKVLKGSDYNLKFDKAIDRQEDTVELWGTGKASREFLYVNDCARAIDKAVEINTTPHPINIGTGSECTIQHLATKIAHIMGYEGTIKFNENGMDGQPRRCLDTSRATRVLGFETKTDLDKGLHDTISWYYKNKEKFVDYFDHIQ